MALNLDTRHRAMLQEMGITVWSPATATTAATITPAALAPVTPAPAALAPATRPLQSPPPAVQAPATSPAHAAPERAEAPPASPAVDTPTWQMAPAVALYPQAADTGPAHDGWLIVWECRNAAQPLEGDSGKLLDNMLRALRLQDHPHIWLASVQRTDAAPLDSLGDTAHAALRWQPLEATLPQQLQQLRPRRLLLLGLPAARAVLASSEALGRLRAQIHDVHGVPAVVSYDPAYLLRSAHAKPAAWADLCRAHALPPAVRP